jgi:hypothetical protein
MDGLSALSIAASVAQFLEFGCSLVSKSKEIYHSVDGALPRNISAEHATRRLIELSEVIKAGLVLDSHQPDLALNVDDALRSICDGCIAASETLLSKLDKLKVQNGQGMRRFKSVRQALKSVWSQKSLDELAERLQYFRREMDAHILVSLRSVAKIYTPFVRFADEFFHISGKFNKLSLLQDEKFTSLDKTLQRTIEPLLKHLVDINTRLNSMSSQHVACESAVEGRKVAPGLQRSDPGSHGTEAELHKKINSALLQALDFPNRTHRQQEIAEAHQRTFSWIFDDQEIYGNGHVTPSRERRPWNSFTEWLREERTPRGIYWMNGKAGSGKSTLMRFVANHVETQRHLKHWAGNADLQVSSFFFWNSGTGLQHSRPGLLRSLLFETLKARPDLTRKLFKAEWKELTETYERHAIINPRVWPFPIRRLEQAFSRLIQIASDDFKLCFFIDGLDESKAEPEELVCLINETARSPFVKICVSSRPWLVFEEAFGLDSSLRLQDLTSSDIQLYVREKLQRDPKMERLETTNHNGARSLVRNIVTKANGVFLWVRIVTKSLLDGLRNWDDFSDLQRRLDELPSDLNALYSHMLDRIEPRYFFQASKIFRIFDAASALNLRPTILELDLAVTANYSTATAPSAVEPSDAELEYRFQRMNTHLKSRCEGLLEAHDIYDRHWESLSGEETQESISWVYRPVVEEARGKKLKACWKVSYLHRTVKDFLDTPSVRGRLETAFDNKTSTDEPFDPYLSLLMSYIINLKQGLRSYYYDSEVWEEERIRKTARVVIHIAGKVDQANRQVLTMLHAFRTLSLQWSGENSFFEAKTLSMRWDEDFLALATCHGLWTFVDEMIQRPTQLSERKNWPSPLRIALGVRPDNCSWTASMSTDLYRLTPAMVKLLLSRGSDPNAVVHSLGQTTWQEFLMNVNQGEFSVQTSQTFYTRCFEVVKLLLEHGADVGSGRRGDSESWSSVTIDEVIDNMFSVRLPEKADELRSLVQQKRSSRKRKVSSDNTQLPSKR